ncbi:TIGR03067 domain-containing protein [Singulisphaera sp. Ch08]|uniref:TIGR03067 domain-containing protein n=1 Tax=Singulisphaera sp. Ch08 TaxID=3120278 RepID=A0AAU7CIW5_9BACT
MPVILLSLLISLPTLDDGGRTPSRTAVEEAHQLLAGTWTVLSVVDDGERIGADLIKQKLVANGEVDIFSQTIHIVSPETGEKKSWIFRLDISQSPHRIELITSDDRVLRGVYKFDNDTLIVCLPFYDETKRADGFDAPVNSGLLRLELKAKAKPLAVQPAAKIASVTPLDPPRATDAEIRRQHELLSGDWTILSIRNNGDDYNADLIRQKIAENNRLHIGWQGLYLTNPRTQEKQSYSMRLDPSRTPRTIDVTNKFDELLHGIYRFEGDTLSICLNKREGLPTPDQFDAPSGSHRVLYRLKMAPPMEPTTATVTTTPPPRTDEAAEQRERVRKLLVGSWSYTDSKGTVTTVLQSDGSFVFTRVRNRKRLFEPLTVTGWGTWNFSGNLLNVTINRSTDILLARRSYVARIQSIGESTMVASDIFGELQNFKRLR